MLIESDIFGTLKYCFEDPRREYFDLFVERFNAVSIIKKKKKDKNGKEYEEETLNTGTFGQYVSEICQLHEDSERYWHEVRMILMQKK